MGQRAEGSARAEGEKGGKGRREGRRGDAAGDNLFFRAANTVIYGEALSPAVERRLRSVPRSPWLQDVPVSSR
jgi:hypothetical protein